MRGYLRADGRKGIRNVVLVAYLVQCAQHVARRIADQFGADVQVIGFPGCYRNDYAFSMMESLCTHPNVAGVLLLSLGCEGFDRARLKARIEASGRPADFLVIQEHGGTRSSIERGQRWIAETLGKVQQDAVAMTLDELVVGTICGGSDGTSGITANPAMGRAFDHLITAGAACIFEETGELIGCERHMAARAQTPELGREIVNAVSKAARYCLTSAPLGRIEVIA